MQPSGGGGGGGGGRSARHPGEPQGKSKPRGSSDDAGPTTVFEFVQGFTPLPNPIARRILGETSLDPEKTDMYASLIGLRDGGMPGFRPLGYASGGTADADLQRQADHQNALEMIKFYLGQGSDRIPPQERVSTNTLRALLDAYEKNPDAAIGYWNRLSKLITSGDDMGDLGAISTAPVAPPLAAAPRLRGSADTAPTGRPADTAPTGTPIPTEEVVGMTSFRPKGPTLDEMGSMFDLYRDGGYVKQKYAYGGSVPHGTVAGELPDYGNMRVREEGESMRELAKRHKDQRWYNRMGGGLGSLMRRA